VNAAGVPAPDRPADAPSDAGVMDGRAAGADFRYDPFPDIDMPLPARLGQFPRQPDIATDVARAVGGPIAAGFIRTQFRFEVVGRVPDVPRLALMPNHQSHLDALAVLSVLPARLRRRVTVLAARDYFFERPAPALVASILWGAVAFDRRSRLSELRRWTRVLHDTPEGWFLVFPQGSRKATSLHAGLPLVLARSGWPVLPVALAGTAEAWPVGAPLWRPFRRIRVTFGEPVEDAGTRDLLDVLAGFWEAHGHLDDPPEGRP
jgi:1-acyl-sn-glycerol-3-phosphate acyltransferase